MKFAIVHNTKKKALPFLRNLIKLLKEYKVCFEIVDTFPFTAVEAEKLKATNFIIILGGDGTVLSTFHHLPTDLTPLFIAINFGRVGYLGSSPNAKTALLIKQCIKFSRQHPQPLASIKTLEQTHPTSLPFKVDQRKLLQIWVGKKNHYALNEAVITKGSSGKPLKLQICLNNTTKTQFLGDGAIIATATGSTAYNLSAGGPILSPNTNAFVFTPICPHSLSLRPIVMAEKDAIEMTPLIEKTPHSPLNNSILMVDGTLKKPLRNSESVKAELARKGLYFIKPKTDDPYKTFQTKLHWG